MPRALLIKLVLCLESGELRKGVKVCVTSKQDKRMFEDESCNPHIVRWDGRSLLTQLPVNGTVVMRCLVVGIEYPNPRFEEETPQDCFIVRSLSTNCKAGAQFAEDNEGQPDFIGELDCLNDRCNTAAKVCVTFGVERQLQGHISSSTVSCASRARSKAGSLCHVPAMSLRSRRLTRSSVTPAPRARASIATSFRLLPCSRAARRRASSRTSGTLRIVYCMHLL